MKVLRLSVDDFCDYHLIAVYTHLQDYKLAYYLNKVLKLHLCREHEKPCLYCPHTQNTYPYYRWEDTLLRVTWHCIANKLSGSQQLDEGFFSTTNTVHYLIDKLKKVDFFLKIDTEGTFNAQHIIAKIQQIPATNAHTVALNTLNIKHKLLFQEC
ncbi:IPExxxVDY family protein [Capnocytophaga leadbetteri]|jgi:hypothetical protein|uniref:IPExxxVDY family protein n=2 Tax=Capnocytophaga TaxID=1016 RepID=UPI0028D1F880|nr:IPExxxVDY family protein [Capnocytophaga leadbetteri]